MTSQKTEIDNKTISTNVEIKIPNIDTKLDNKNIDIKILDIKKIMMNRHRQSTKQYYDKNRDDIIEKQKNRVKIFINDYEKFTDSEDKKLLHPYILALDIKLSKNTKTRHVVVKNYIRQIKEIVSDNDKVRYTSGTYYFWINYLNDLIKKHNAKLTDEILSKLG